jgi:hypothetical protein
MMSPDVKKLWIDALLSGEFEQGKHTLQTTDGKYCCLGVLCEVYRRETGRGEWKSHASPCGAYFEVDGHKGRGVLPDPVMAWAGLREENPVIDDVTLARWNDSRDASFKGIANLIEVVL